MKITITQPELVRVAAMFVSTEETRYYLNGVYFCKAKRGGVYIISTDGHRMSIGYDAKGKIDKPATIRFPVEFLKHLTPKREIIMLHIDGLLASIVAVDKKGKPDKKAVAVCSTVVIDGTYPEWRRVVPTADDLTRCHGSFSTKYLADYKAVLTALGIGGVGPVNIVGATPDSPHRVHISGVDNWFGVLMPMRYDGKTDIPAWFDAAPKEPKP